MGPILGLITAAKPPRPPAAPRGRRNGKRLPPRSPDRQSRDPRRPLRERPRRGPRPPQRRTASARAIQQGRRHASERAPTARTSSGRADKCAAGPARGSHAGNAGGAGAWQGTGRQPADACADTVIAAAPRRQQQAAGRQEITSGMRAAARYAAAHSGQDAGAAAPARIPESDAFKRARARRDAGRLEPVVSNESLAQLAKARHHQTPTTGLSRRPSRQKSRGFFRRLRRLRRNHRRGPDLLHGQRQQLGEAPEVACDCIHHPADAQQGLPLAARNAAANPTSSIHEE